MLMTSRPSRIQPFTGQLLDVAPSSEADSVMAGSYSGAEDHLAAGTLNEFWSWTISAVEDIDFSRSSYAPVCPQQSQFDPMTGCNLLLAVFSNSMSADHPTLGDQCGSMLFRFLLCESLTIRPRRTCVPTGLLRKDDYLYATAALDAPAR
jgi:hypothetical protein